MPEDTQDTKHPTALDVVDSTPKAVMISADLGYIRKPFACQLANMESMVGECDGYPEYVIIDHRNGTDPGARYCEAHAQRATQMVAMNRALGLGNPAPSSYSYHPR